MPELLLSLAQGQILKVLDGWPATLLTHEAYTLKPHVLVELASELIHDLVIGLELRQRSLRRKVYPLA